MKEYSKYRFTEYRTYYREICDTFELELLGDFLRTEVGSGFEEFIEWVNDSNFDGFCGNLVFCDKTEQSIVIYFDPFVVEDPNKKLTVSKKTFIGIMQDWGRLYKEKPKEIIITRDGDIVTLEGKN